MFDQWSARKKGLVAAITTAGSWSVLAIFLKLALGYSDSYSIVWYRMAVAFLALAGWMVFKGQSQDLKVLSHPPFLLVFASLCLAANYLGFMQGVHYTSPSNAQIFIQLGPLTLAVIGVIFFKEHLSLRQYLGFGFCILGFSLFFIDRVNIVPSHELTIGLSWIIMAAMTWALFASIQKHLLKFIKSSQINVFIYALSSLIFLPMVNWSSLAEVPWFAHLLFSLLGLNTLLAYGCLSVALRYLPATEVSPIITMNPLMTLFLLFLMDLFAIQIIPADPVSITGYIGAILAVFGIQQVLSKKTRPKTV